MEYKVENDLWNFQAWSGGKDTLETLKEKGDTEEVESLIEEMFYGETPTETDINDFLWFERDCIAEHLGYRDWEAYEEGWSEEDLGDAEEWWEGLDYAERSEVCGILWGEESVQEQEEAAIDEWWDGKSDKEKVEIYYENE